MSALELKSKNVSWLESSQVKDLKNPDLDTYSSQTVAIFNRWYSQKSSLRIPLNKTNIYIRPNYVPDIKINDQFLNFQIITSEGSLGLHLEKEGLQQLFRVLPEKIDVSIVPPADLAILLEFALLSAIEPFELRNQTQLKIVNCDMKSNPHPAPVLIGSFSCEGIDSSFLFAISDFNEHPFFSKPLDLPKSSPARNTAAEKKLNVPLSLILAAVTLPSSECKNLHTGDIVLLHGRKTIDTHYEIWVGHTYLFSAQKNEKNEYEISHHIRNEYIIDKTVNHESKTMTQAKNIEKIPVTLTFEIGRKILTFEELSTLNTGSVVEFADTKTNDISILANGEKVGGGTLLQVGEDLGVRVDWIFKND